MNAPRGLHLSSDKGSAAGSSGFEETEIQGPTFLGHPTGLFALFFAEMWERFSYYGMRALLVFYMIKGFLKFDDEQAYGVYGAYTALVYMTPFFGGMIADRFLGPRISVIIGGLLMAAGHLLMAMPGVLAFYSALALLIAGNGFFKPNISTMVGSLYPKGSIKRDGGFTIFYMGINLGAAMSPLLCGYIGENYGWHWGFGLATIGMLIGLAVFVMPTKVSQALILSGALLAALGLFFFHPDNIYTTGINFALAIALIMGAVSAIIALNRGGLPAGMGGPPKGANLGFSLPITLLGTAAAIAIFVLLVSGFSMFNDGKPISVLSDDYIKSFGSDGFNAVIGTVLKEVSKPAGLVLCITGILAFGYLIFETFRLDRIGRDRMIVVLTLTFFSMLFWSFFEQAGSSVNNFTDRNVDRVLENRTITAEEIGTSIRIQPTQEQLGYMRGASIFTQEEFDAMKKDTNPKDEEKDINPNDEEVVTILWTVAEEHVGLAIRQREAKAKPGQTEREVVERALEAKDIGLSLEILPSAEWVGRSRGAALFTLTHLDKLRADYAATDFTIEWKVAEDNVGMGIATRNDEIPASVFQSINPGFILVLGLIFTALWATLATLKIEPSTPIKFALGLIQLGLGFYCFYLGAEASTDRGMVAIPYLIAGYFFQTTGELCLSPVGLSMITKLSPKILVSTVMGGWFLATAFSQYLAAIISQFTGVGHGTSEEKIIPIPALTVDIYGGVFFKIALAAIASGVICLLLSPILSYCMHKNEEDGD